jgi:hypothetical protein
MTIFNAGLIRFVGQTKIRLLLKIQKKQHPILNVLIVYKHNMMRRESKLTGRGAQILIMDRSTKAVETHQVFQKSQQDGKPMHAL